MSLSGKYNTSKTLKPNETLKSRLLLYYYYALEYMIMVAKKENSESGEDGCIRDDMY